MISSALEIGLVIAAGAYSWPWSSPPGSDRLVRGGPWLSCITRRPGLPAFKGAPPRPSGAPGDATAFGLVSRRVLPGYVCPTRWLPQPSRWFPRVLARCGACRDFRRWPREESNLRPQIRSLSLYPLSYGAVQGVCPRRGERLALATRPARLRACLAHVGDEHANDVRIELRAGEAHELVQSLVRREASRGTGGSTSSRRTHRMRRRSAPRAGCPHQRGRRDNRFRPSARATSERSRRRFARPETHGGCARRRACAGARMPTRARRAARACAGSRPGLRAFRDRAAVLRARARRARLGEVRACARSPARAIRLPRRCVCSSGSRCASASRSVAIVRSLSPRLECFCA